MSDLKLRYDLDEIRKRLAESEDNPRHAMLALFDGLERMTFEIKDELSAVRRAIEAKN